MCPIFTADRPVGEHRAAGLTFVEAWERVLAENADAVARFLAREAQEVRYGNFKQSIGENFYHDACLSVWTEMFIWSKKLMGILKPMRKAA